MRLDGEPISIVRAIEVDRGYGRTIPVGLTLRRL